MTDLIGELIGELLDEYNHDPRALLESLCQALPRAVLVEHLEWISDVEDWTFKVNAKGEIYDSEKESRKEGEHETI